MWDCANRQISWLMSKPYKIFFIYFDTTFETNFVEEIPHYVILHLLTPLFSHLTHCDFFVWYFIENGMFLKMFWNILFTKKGHGAKFYSK